MGKKGTKRKTKWRALPLGEEAGGSGNEEDLYEEDQSTTSSVFGGQTAGVSFRRPSFYYKMADKQFRQTRRFVHDKSRSKEPLVKLESKTFDEEEYTKITTPRQDVLFKKGYFGRKREFSVEETPSLVGEMDGEETMMDQIIITNGFVDERGHYLVNGNSYEIYDPYSNTVTLVVGPPPYANGVTQPVLAAVSCQPVPLQPVDWYPPGADWPAQGSAWTPSYPTSPHPDSASAPDGAPGFPSSDSQISNLYNQPAYVVPGFAYSESPLFNGVPLQTNPLTEIQNSEENRLEPKKTRRKSTETAREEDNDSEKENEKTKPNQTDEQEVKTNEAHNGLVIAQVTKEIASVSTSLPSSYGNQSTSGGQGQVIQRQTVIMSGQVETQSHSTQTTLIEETLRSVERHPGKESHSTQTPPEGTLLNNHANTKAQERDNKILSDGQLSSLPKNEGEKKLVWKPQGSRFPGPLKKFREESPRKASSHQRINFTDERKLNVEKPDSSPFKVSYAKKAMTGLENGNPKFVNSQSGKMVSGAPKNQSPCVNGMYQVVMNGTSRAKGAKQTLSFEDKRNGFVKAKYNRGKTTSDHQTNPKYRDKNLERRLVNEPEKISEELIFNEAQSPSEKSSTISELSSPTALSSGQNTPPEKLIVQKMEEEINRSFEEKLKQNLTRKEKEIEKEKEKVKPIEEDKEREVENNENDNEKGKEGEGEEETKCEDNFKGKPKGKKKKNKGKAEGNKAKESRREKKKKKRRAEEEAKEKSESDNSSEEIAFLSNNPLFGGWGGFKNEGEDFISEMNSLLDGDEEILKSLGLKDERSSYSKLPLHSDLLMMLPTFGWTRPKLKIEDFFAPPSCENDFFTKRNITNMKSTKPEEFFASVIEGPAADKMEKKKEQHLKKASKSEELSPSSKKTSKVGFSEGKNRSKKAKSPEDAKKVGPESNEVKLGIVEAVNTWLQEQRDSEKFISVESLETLATKKENSPEKEETNQKNGVSNPIHAPSRDEDSANVIDFRANGECIRVANVITDGFVHVTREFPPRKRPASSGRIYRSSSWDAKLSEGNIKKHLKFLTDSASFCQDLISDVRNGLPAGNEYATEELCDPRQTVAKYYTLSPNGRPRNESDSENEVFDALEYKFMTKESSEGDGKSPDGNGNVSITDSGVHSDMESSEDNVPELQKEATCKLQ